MVSGESVAGAVQSLPVAVATPPPITYTSVATPRAPHVRDNTHLNALFELMAEDIVLSHAPYMSPNSANALLPKDGANTWVHTLQQFSTLGYKPQDPDPWILLGLSKFEGPAPCESDVLNRKRSALQISSLCTLQEDSPSLDGFVSRVNDATQCCLDELPSILRERKKREKNACNWRWMEICPDFLAYSCKRWGGEGWRFALHMTNLHGVRMEHLFHTLLN